MPIKLSQPIPLILVLAMEASTEFPEDARVTKGKHLAELIWWSLAKRIIRLAGEEYQWSDEQWQDFSQIFLRPTDYSVQIIS